MAENKAQTMVDPEPVSGGTGFSQEYVAELRRENAHWRNKLRDVETVVQQYQQAEKDYQINDRISKELTERGLTDVDPVWVDVGDGQDINKAVDAFLEKHPRFKVGLEDPFPAPADKEEHAPARGKVTPPMSVERKNTNVSKYPSDYQSMKKDPMARSKLRDLYRGLLSAQQNTGLTI